VERESVEAGIHGVSSFGFYVLCITLLAQVEKSAQKWRKKTTSKTQVVGHQQGQLFLKVAQKSAVIVNEKFSGRASKSRASKAGNEC
jgi:hypothetical protein